MTDPKINRNKKPQLKLIHFKKSVWISFALLIFFKGNVVNLTCHPINGESLDITYTLQPLLSPFHGDRSEILKLDRKLKKI